MYYNYNVLKFLKTFGEPCRKHGIMTAAAAHYRTKAG